MSEAAGRWPLHTRILLGLGQNLGLVPPEATSATVQVVVNLAGLRLETFGEHMVGLQVDGRPAATTPLFVRRAG